MDIEKLFNDLESSQTQDCDEAKKKLVEKFMQTKESWLVHGMMDHFLKTGSLRIMEVLVKVQSPHDTYIFDRLDEWLKGPTNRIHALNLFGFIVRKHPTWLFKVEKHKLIKNILRLLQTEKEIVSLMSALLCIITLLPIIPNLVPNFLSDLFDIFGHLASWNCQNPNKLPDDKLVHLQLGLQMLFHRLYGMYPCNFFAYITEFIKKEKGAIFHHTIKPLLETVRVHPMLVTATIETEVSPSRWKEMEPHDVVVECAKLSLPVSHQELVTDNPSNSSACLQDTPNSVYINPITYRCSQNQERAFAFYGSNVVSPFQSLNDREQFSQFQNSNSIWSPSTEISTGAIPLTPTPSYVFPLSNAVTTSNIGQILGVTGSSPPEAAVEATPETTPLKDINVKRSSNPHAVRAILTSSQPSSPMRKEPNQFNFPETSPNHLQQNVVEQQTRVNKITPGTLHDRMVQQIMNDRNRPQSPQAQFFGETHKDRYHRNLFNTSLFSSDTYDDCADQEDIDSNTLPPCAATNAVEHIAKICDDCDETERSMCSAGGLHIPTTRSMQILAKGIKRNRMTSYCYNYFCEKTRPDANSVEKHENIKVRRTKSCSAIVINPVHEKGKDYPSKIAKKLNVTTLPSATHVITKQPSSITTSITQTVQTWPQNYECSLYEMFFEGNKLRNSYECNLLYPQEILNQYVDRTIKTKDNIDTGYRIDQEQFQLICLQLQYERYRREIHAERNRRLMGRSRDKRSLEMERDRLRDQLKGYTIKNKELMTQIDKATKLAKERYQKYTDELGAIKSKYQLELERTKSLRLANENLQSRLNDEIANRKDVNYELEILRGQIFDMRTEFQHAQMQAELGMQCKQELARLEAEFIIMGEVQIKCRDKLAELDIFKAKDEELFQLQETYNIEIKELKQALEYKSYQFDSAKHKLCELQCQLANNEKVFTEQKRLLKTVKDEYEEKFKAISKKYEIQKSILLRMEEKIMSLHRSPESVVMNASSTDTKKADLALSVERNSPLPTYLAPGESLSASLRSTELRNLQHLVVEPVNVYVPESTTQIAGHNSFNSNAESRRLPILDVNSSAFTSSSLSSMSTVMPSINQLNAQNVPCDTGSIVINNPTYTLDMPVPATSTSHHHFQNTHQQHQSSSRNQYPNQRR